ncbi:MAG: hypothetical protein BWY32_02002 [bacterium ADurb.Bin243]|nr:MAG: hypothetical protein BWY32_02002 [bacterium ADurb.Bin243]
MKINKFLVIIIAVFFIAAGYFSPAACHSKETETKAAADKAKKPAAEKTSAEEITPDEDEPAETETQASAGASQESKPPAGSSKENKGGGYNFSYSAESKVEKMSRERMKEKTFLDKISNEFFEIYVDEDDFTVLANFPFGKAESAYNLKFKDENILVVTFTHKTDKSKKPVRYEIHFPEPTKKEVYDFSVRDKLELNVPIDFFYAERKNFR